MHTHRHSGFCVVIYTACHISGLFWQMYCFGMNFNRRWGLSRGPLSWSFLETKPLYLAGLREYDRGAIHTLSFERPLSDAILSTPPVFKVILCIGHNSVLEKPATSTYWDQGVVFKRLPQNFRGGSGIGTDVCFECNLTYTFTSWKL